jgi:ribonucleoside-diphosphate reductase alpha chain
LKHIELNNQVNVRKDGFFQIEKDKEAAREFLKEVHNNLVTFNSIEEQITYMVENDYYYPEVLTDYSMKQIQEIFETAYSYNFEFQSYMAVSKFYKDYAMKTNDKSKYLETYEDRVSIVSLYLAKGNMKNARKFVRAIIEQRYQPATPTFLNAGKSRRGEMVSCFLLEMDDTLNSIGFNINTSMQLSKIGGGVK